MPWVGNDSIVSVYILQYSSAWEEGITIQEVKLLTHMGMKACVSWPESNGAHLISQITGDLQPQQRCEEHCGLQCGGRV